MIHLAAEGITTGSRLFFAAVLLLGVGVAFIGASPCWANRIWSDAQAVKAVVAQQLHDARHQPTRPADAVPASTDDYVEGLARRGIASIPGFPASRTSVDSTSM